MKKILYKAFIVEPKIIGNARAKRVALQTYRKSLRNKYPDHDEIYVDLVVRDNEYMAARYLLDRPGLGSALDELDHDDIVFCLPDMQSLSIHETRLMDFYWLLKNNNIPMEIAGKEMDEDDFVLDAYVAYTKRIMEEYIISLNPAEMASVISRNENGVPIIQLASDKGLTDDDAFMLTDLLEKEPKGVIIAREDGLLDHWDEIACGQIRAAIDELAPMYYRYITEVMLETQPKPKHKGKR